MQLQIHTNAAAFIAKPGDASSVITLLSKLAETDCLGAEPLKTGKLLARLVTYFQKVGVQSQDSFQVMLSKLYDTYIKRLGEVEQQLERQLTTAIPDMLPVRLLDTQKFPIQVTWAGEGPGVTYAIAFDPLAELTPKPNRWIMFRSVTTENTGSRAVLADITSDFGGYDLTKIGEPNAL